MPGNYPEENLQNTEHGESLKSRIDKFCPFLYNQNLCSHPKFIVSQQAVHV
jgi:hypothetical protein